jgi:DNA-binding transcriptional ArsR family regulator
VRLGFFSDVSPGSVMYTWHSAEDSLEMIVEARAFACTGLLLGVGKRQAMFIQGPIGYLVEGRQQVIDPEQGEVDLRRVLRKKLIRWPINVANGRRKVEFALIGRYSGRYMADKLALLEYFRSHPGIWASAADIVSATGRVADRTLRNWLRELVGNGSVESKGERKGRRYRLREYSIASPAEQLAVAEQPRIAQSIFSPHGQSLINRVEAPLYDRPPTTYREDLLRSYVPNESGYLTSRQCHELAALGKRDPIYGRAGTFIKSIYDRLLIDLAFNSSRLEGNTYTLLDTERLLLQGAAAPGKLDAERVMILNHKEAISYLVRNAQSLQVNEVTIRTLHYLLADSLVAPGVAGQIRGDSIRVSGTTYSPIDGRERLKRLLFSVLEKARAIRNPFEQGFFLLVHISYLQAFIDVNKRTARLASIIPLIAKDFVPQSFVEVDRRAYFSATIAIYELNEVVPLAELYVWCYQRSCQRFDTNVQVVGFDEVAARYRAQRRALVAKLVCAKVMPAELAEWITVNLPIDPEPQHREKFISDVFSEVENLDASRIGGLGITLQELEDWQQLRRQVART